MDPFLIDSCQSGNTLEILIISKSYQDNFSCLDLALIAQFWNEMTSGEWYQAKCALGQSNEQIQVFQKIFYTESKPFHPRWKWSEAIMSAENQPLNGKSNPMWIHVLLLRERIGMEQNWTILCKVDSVKTVRTGLTSSTLFLYVSICLSIYRSWSYAVNISCWLSLSDNFVQKLVLLTIKFLAALSLRGSGPTV